MVARSEQADPVERLAPVAIVRAAAWSLDSLESLVVDDASIDHAHRVEHERQRLWALTAGSPAFMRALSLSNPTLAERVELAYADGKRFDQGFFVGRRAVLGVVTGGTPERFSAGGSYGPMPEVLYPLRRCILEYLGLEVMEPFVAYAAPRVDAATRAEYLRGFEACLLATAGDPDWQARLSAAAGATAHNRVIPEGKAWAAQR